MFSFLPLSYIKRIAVISSIFISPFVDATTSGFPTKIYRPDPTTWVTYDVTAGVLSYGYAVNIWYRALMNIIARTDNKPIVTVTHSLYQKTDNLRTPTFRINRSPSKIYLLCVTNFCDCSRGVTGFEHPTSHSNHIGLEVVQWLGIRCPLTQKTAHQYVSQIISIDRNPVIELRFSESCAVHIGPKITLFDLRGLVCVVSRHLTSVETGGLGE